MYKSTEKAINFFDEAIKILEEHYDVSYLLLNSDKSEELGDAWFAHYIMGNFLAVFKLNEPVYFFNIPALSTFLVDFDDINKKDYIEIILDVIKKNIGNGFLDSTFYDVSPVFENEEEYKGFVDMHKVINDHYFEKIDSFDLEDIQIIKDTLKKYIKSDDYLESLDNYFDREYYRRINKEKEEVNIKPITFNFSKNEDIISQKEYNKIYHEIQNVYSIENDTLLKDLSFREIVELLDKMKKINLDEHHIKKFITRTFINPDFNEINPITYYNNFMYQKMKYFEDDIEISESLNNINNYLKEMMVCDDESYEYWKREGITKELRKSDKNIRKKVYR